MLGRFVHRGKVKKLTEKHRKKWLVNHSNHSDVMCKHEKTKRHVAQWWWLREFSLQKVRRQMGTSQGYPFASGMAICLQHEAESRVACRRACILIGLICSTIGRCRLIKKCQKSADQSVDLYFHPNYFETCSRHQILNEFKCTTTKIMKTNFFKEWSHNISNMF